MYVCTYVSIVRLYCIVCYCTIQNYCTYVLMYMQYFMLLYGKQVLCVCSVVLPVICNGVLCVLYVTVI